MAKILISTSSFGKYNKDLLDRCRVDNEIVLNPFGRKLSPEELVELGSDADGIIAGTEKIDKVSMERMTKLRVISRCGAGLDSIDIVAAEKLSIKIYNTPDAPTRAVAELTLGLILDLLRKISLSDRNLRSGKWNKITGNLLKGKKIGIIGYGRIGKELSILLQPFQTDISFFDINQISSEFASPMPMNELLGWADIITLHCSIIHGKECIIGEKELALMKKSSFLVNASRGELVDESALYDSLRNGKISGAAIDVFSTEPYDGKLIEVDNIILTPHIGSYALESRIEMEIQSVRNLFIGLGLKDDFLFQGNFLKKE